MEKPSVLITDGDLKVTLPVLRSLARKNVQTGVAAPRTKAMSFFSKYCKTKFMYPSPRDNLGLFLKVIKKIVEESGFDVLFPVGEWTLVPISKNRESIASRIELPFASKEAIEKTFNKSLTLEIAMKEDVPMPRTFFVQNLSELQKVAHDTAYPAVIKSRFSWFWDGDKASFSRPIYVNSPQELLAKYKSMHSDFPFPIIQEYVPGTAYHIGVLCNHSRLKAACCIKEHRTIPVTGGYATLRETVDLNHKMLKPALQMLKALEWHGIAEVEFKLDSRDSMPKFMEINGRFWGSLELAIEAGIDFPYLLYRLAVDGDVKPAFDYVAGVKRRWLEGDLVYISNVLKNVGAYTGVQYPRKWRALLDFLKVYDCKLDCFYWDDPLPFLSGFLWGDIPGIFSRKLMKRLGRSVYD